MIYCVLCGAYESVISDTGEPDVIIIDNVCMDCREVQDVIYEQENNKNVKRK